MRRTRLYSTSDAEDRSTILSKWRPVGNRFPASQVLTVTTATPKSLATCLRGDVLFQSPVAERSCKAGADVAVEFSLLSHGERLPDIRVSRPPELTASVRASLNSSQHHRTSAKIHVLCYGAWRR